MLRWVSRFEAAARRDPVEIDIQIDLQQRRGMISRASRCRGQHPLEAQRRQVQLVDEDIDHANWIILDQIIVQAIGK